MNRLLDDDRHHRIRLFAKYARFYTAINTWPQQQIGLALWSLATTGEHWQETETLMRLSVLPDEAVLRNPDYVAPTLFATRVLRPLRWFGLVECRDEGKTREEGMWRKSALFDRFLHFDTDLARTGGSLH